LYKINNININKVRYRLNTAQKIALALYDLMRIFFFNPIGVLKQLNVANLKIFFQAISNNESIHGMMINILKKTDTKVNGLKTDRYKVGFKNNHISKALQRTIDQYPELIRTEWSSVYCYELPPKNSNLLRILSKFDYSIIKELNEIVWIDADRIPQNLQIMPSSLYLSRVSLEKYSEVFQIDISNCSPTESIKLVSHLILFPNIQTIQYYADTTPVEQIRAFSKFVTLKITDIWM